MHICMHCFTDTRETTLASDLSKWLIFFNMLQTIQQLTITSNKIRKFGNKISSSWPPLVFRGCLSFCVVVGGSVVVTAPCPRRHPNRFHDTAITYPKRQRCCICVTMHHSKMVMHCNALRREVCGNGIQYVAVAVRCTAVERQCVVMHWTRAASVALVR